MKHRILASILAGGILMGGMAFPAQADAGTSTKTINATGGLDQQVPNCDGSQVEAYFVINQLDSSADAPASITVSFSNGGTATEPLLVINGPVAKYQGPVPAGATVTGASATIYGAWEGQFNLSHYFCGESIPTTTTTVPETTTTTIPKQTTTTVPSTTTTVPVIQKQQAPLVPQAETSPSTATQSMSSLPLTGSDSVPLSLGGLGLITLGLGIVKLSRRKG